MTKVRLDKFDAKKNLDRGRSKLVEVFWYICKCLFFLSPLPWPISFKIFLLRFFGAKVGHGVVIKPRVNIHFPWKLELKDHVWIGEEVFILNFEPVEIGSNSCLSQRVFLCAGNHDFRSEDFAYRNAPIKIEEGVWVGAQVFVGPGVVIGEDAVICAGSVVVSDQQSSMICRGNPAKAVSPRWK